MQRRTFLGLSAGAVAVTLTNGAIAAPDAYRTAVAELARRLEGDYVIPDVGAKYAAMLRANAAAGRYDGAADLVFVANQLTGDLRAIAADNHLRVVSIDGLPAGTMVAPLAGTKAGPDATDAGPPAPPRSGPLRPPALQDAGWIAPGVAYIRFTGFTGDPTSLAQIDAFMHDHAAARAMIVDCRYNGGGGIDEMNVMLPYLYARETPLVQMDVSEKLFAAEGPPFSGPTIRRVKGPAGVVRSEHVAIPHATEKRLFGVPVFYLISGRTASAGEHLSLAFKRTRRATLIGEHTAGANHFGEFEAIGAGLAVFLPVGRTLDPDTGKDWEGTGILPDIEVPPVRALEEALRRAGAIAA